MKWFLVLVLIISIIFIIAGTVNAQQSINFIKVEKTEYTDGGVDKTRHLEQENHQDNILSWIAEEIEDYVYAKIMDFIETLKPGSTYVNTKGVDNSSAQV